MKKQLSSMFLTICVILTVCFTSSIPAEAGGGGSRLFVWEEGAGYQDSSGVALQYWETGPLPSGSGNGWSYDGSKHTLTLRNFRGGGLEYGNTNDDTPVTVVLEGDNTIVWSDEQRNGAIEFMADMVIRGDGSLTVVGGIRVDGNLTLESGTIVTTGTKGSNYHGLDVYGTVTVNGGSLTAAPGGGDEFDAGISCSNLIMTGGKVATTRTDEYTYQEAVIVPAEGVDPSEVFNPGYMGLRCSNNLDLRGGELSVTGDISCHHVQFSPNMVATCTLEGQGAKRFPLEITLDSGNSWLGLPLELEDLMNLTITSITVTSSTSGNNPTETTPTDSNTTNPADTSPAVNTAYASTQNVEVDGKVVKFQMYALKDANGYETNYIKLRDLASVLTGTQAQFEVGWNGAVNIENGKPYTTNGSEMNTPFSGDRAYETNTAPTNIDGVSADLTAIVLKDDNGGAYTYYQLRDLGKALGFNVDWASGRGIFVETGKPYSGK